MKNLIIVALDDLLPWKELLTLAQNLAPHVGGYKISAYIDRYGSVGIIDALKQFGRIVMTDLKINDIPSQAARRVAEHILAGADFVTVHAQGGNKMIKECARVAPTQLIAVTVLSSLGEVDTKKLFGGNIRETVEYLAHMAYKNNAAGIVCAPQDLLYLDKNVAAEHFIKFTPNVRPSWSAVRSDQNIGRSMTPQDALKSGAHYVIIGRPILNARDPIIAARRILSDIEQAFA